MARFLALDWDQNQLHLVAATVGRGSVRVQRAAVWQEEQSPNPGNAEELGALLKTRLREAGLAGAPVLATVSRDRLIVKEVRYPAVPAAEEPALVRFQAVKELSDNPDEIILDYLVTSPPEAPERRALALVIRKELLQTYQTLCAAAGLKLAGLAPRPLGIAACLGKVMGTTVVTPPPEPADAAVAVVVVSDRWAEFLVLRNGSLVLARALNAGPHLAAEVRRNLAVHNGQNSQSPVKAIYVTGRGSGELRSHLAELVEAPIHALDPFAGSETVDLPVATRGTFAGATGLLYAKAAGELPVNFVAPRQPVVERSSNYRLARLGLVAGVALFIGLIGLGRVLHANAEARLQDAESRAKLVEDRLTKTREDAKRLKTLEEWENIVWLDEFYDLTARIPDVNSLRITAIQAEPLPRSGKSGYIATMTIRGRLLDNRDPRKPLNELIANFKKEGHHYSLEAPKVEKDQFTLRVHVSRRPPNEYKTVVKIPERKGEPPPEAKEGEEGDWGPDGWGPGGDRGGRTEQPKEDTQERSRGKGKGKGKRN